MSERHLPTPELPNFEMGTQDDLLAAIKQWLLGGRASH
jgi:hypothetical protein